MDQMESHRIFTIDKSLLLRLHWKRNKMLKVSSIRWCDRTGVCWNKIVMYVPPKCGFKKLQNSYFLWIYKYNLHMYNWFFIHTLLIVVIIFCIYFHAGIQTDTLTRTYMHTHVRTHIPYFPYFPPQWALQFAKGGTANISRITFSSKALQKTTMWAIKEVFNSADIYWWKLVLLFWLLIVQVSTNRCRHC